MIATRAINGFKNYQCTIDGNVIGKRGKILKGMVDRCGYHEVSLTKDGKSGFYLTHRLILSTFLPIEHLNHFDVNHKNGNKLDNRLSNLEWVTRSQNIRHSYDNGLQKVITNPHGTYEVLSKSEQDKIVELHLKGYLDRDIAVAINRSRSVVSKIIRKKGIR